MNLSYKCLSSEAPGGGGALPPPPLPTPPNRGVAPAQVWPCYYYCISACGGTWRCQQTLVCVGILNAIHKFAFIPSSACRSGHSTGCLSLMLVWTFWTRSRTLHDGEDSGQSDKDNNSFLSCWQGHSLRSSGHSSCRYRHLGLS